MFSQISSRLGFRHLFHVTSSRNVQQFFPCFTRSLSLSPSGLLVSPIKITPHKLLLINKPRSSISKSVVLAGLGLGLVLVTWNRPAIRCEAPDSRQPNTTNSTIYPENYPAPPVSSVSFYELGFGTVAGICAGVFIKKGAKALAFLLGGVFVLLQYLNSTSVVRVDWGRAASRFEHLFYTKDALGIAKPPNVMSLWNGIVDFLTADFQPRASFIAGLALGLRIG